MARQLFLKGSFFIALGALILLYARPMLTWNRIVIEEFGFQFDYPYTGWSIEHGPSTLRGNVVQQIGEDAARALAASGESQLPDRDAAMYRIRLLDMESSTEIRVFAIPLFHEGLTPSVMSAVMEEVHESVYGDYMVLYSQDVQVDHRDAFCRVATYTDHVHEKPQRLIVVVTYVVEDAMLYSMSLIASEWFALPRNLRIYNHLVNTFHIR